MTQLPLPILKGADFQRDTLLEAVRERKGTASRSSGYAPDAYQVNLACTFAARVVHTYWSALQARSTATLDISKLPQNISMVDLNEALAALASDIGSAAAALDPVEAGYQIGRAYTALLPAELRSRRGIYYTPPALVKRLIDMATEAGVDWQSCRVLDPACGGGAFLTPVAMRIGEALSGSDPSFVLQSMSRRLRGFEIDPFGAWMSQVLLDAALLETCHNARRRLPPLVTVCDSLERKPDGEGFDLVIGNPPYGRVSLLDGLRRRYARSLYGHANLYGLFTDLALHWTRPSGVVAYVTPTSFLGGQYFKSLRALLARESPPVAIDLVDDRKGVFENVLQETMLATYRLDKGKRAVSVHVVAIGDRGVPAVRPAGDFILPAIPEEPWLLPRTLSQVQLIDRLRSMPHRIRDYGYHVSTGPLVWNRHKTQFLDAAAPGAYPVIWAEAVTTDGCFAFRAEKKNHRPYFLTRPGDGWLVSRTPCVLVQRTTAKEQRRRLVAAELPESFVKDYEAVVVENHLNMVRPVIASPAVSSAVVASLLNSHIVDDAFRCINGSVAVSAYELEALPVPAPERMRVVEQLIRDGASVAKVDIAIRHLYLGDES